MMKSWCQFFELVQIEVDDELGMYTVDKEHSYTIPRFHGPYGEAGFAGR